MKLVSKTDALWGRGGKGFERGRGGTRVVVRGVSWCWATGREASVWKRPLRGAGGREGMSGPDTSISPTSPVRREAPMGSSRCFRVHPLPLEAFQILHKHKDPAMHTRAHHPGHMGPSTCAGSTTKLNPGAKTRHQTWAEQPARSLDAPRMSIPSVPAHQQNTHGDKLPHARVTQATHQPSEQWVYV